MGERVGPLRVPSLRLVNRRHVLRQLTAGMAGSPGLRAIAVDAEPPLETTKLRLVKIPSICPARSTPFATRPG